MAVLAACTVWLQYVSGAYSAELSGYPDEPAHYVTSLMFDQYVRAGFPDPIRYAEQYYVRYPQVGIGHWPPLFYVIQGVWTLVMSPARVSVLLLQAALMVGLAALLRWHLATLVGDAVALAVGLLFLAIPIVQAHLGMVMAEILLTGLMYGASLMFASYLAAPTFPRSMAFGFLATAAVLTKGNAWALATVPLLAIVLTRRWSVLTRLSFYCGALPVLLVGVPWQMATAHMAAQGWAAPAPSVTLSLQALVAFGRLWWQMVGGAVILAAAVGAWSTVVAPWRRHAVAPTWAAMGALIVSVWAFHCFVPAGIEPRKLMLALPALMAFAAAGCAAVAGALPPWGERDMRGAIIVVGLAATFLIWTFEVPEKQSFGFREAAKAIHESREVVPDAAVLVSSWGDGEGLFIGEYAMLQPEPQQYIVRGSKLLAEMDWAGGSYRPLYGSPDEVRDVLDTIPIGVVVLDERLSPRRAHQVLLSDVVRRDGTTWRLIGRFGDRGDAQPAVVVYRRAGPIQPVQALEVNTERMLGRKIVGGS